MIHKYTLRTILAIITFFAYQQNYAQEVLTLKQSDFKPNAQPDIFKCITNVSDTAKGHYMATLQIKLGNNANAFTNGYVDIREYATNLKANAFRLNNYTTDDKGNRLLTLDVYYFEDTKQIVRSEYQNKIYIFCDDRDNDKTYDLKVNNEKVNFRSGTYLQYETKPNEQVKLNKGGATGMQVKLVYEDQKLPVFLSMSSFGLEPASMGVGFNTGRFSTINTNLGYLLIQCLKTEDKK